MTPSAERHMQKYRSARTSTLVWLEKRDGKTAEIQRENEAQRPLARKSLWRRILDAIISGCWGV